MRVYAGADGGGTRTTLALEAEDGRELARVTGPAGLVDPRRPEASAGVVAELVLQAVEEAGVAGVPVALCAGLAGVGNEAERAGVERALAARGVAGRVRVVTDGEIALDGALGGGPGILLIAGTGSVGYGRGVDGRVERCGGWGMIVGDEGSGYALGRAGLVVAVRAVDGRGPRTVLLPRLLALLELEGPRAIPPWAGRAEKAEVAALATHVAAAAEDGDAVAVALVDEGAREIAGHAQALAARLGPWPGPVPVVFHGGVLGMPLVASRVRARLEAEGFQIRPGVADAVAGALRFARALGGAGEAEREPVAPAAGAVGR